MQRGEFVVAGDAYERHRPWYRGLAGYYALIHGDRLVGLFPTRESAESAWMVLHGPVPVYLRQITEADAMAGQDRAGPSAIHWTEPQMYRPSVSPGLHPVWD